MAKAKWIEEDEQKVLEVKANWSGWKYILAVVLGLIPLVVFFYYREGMIISVVSGFVDLLWLLVVIALIRPQCKWRFLQDQFTRNRFWRIQKSLEVFQVQDVLATVLVKERFGSQIRLLMRDWRELRLPRSAEVHQWAEEHLDIKDDLELLSLFQRKLHR
ncbi:MAG: hypothetical protein QGG25_02600 [Phycisphaerae bacterium]|jgi:hypothetical protein|nr:hypothetical protein [Phycisphaerae bacterium]